MLLNTVSSPFLFLYSECMKQKSLLFCHGCFVLTHFVSVTELKMVPRVWETPGATQQKAFSVPLAGYSDFTMNEAHPVFFRYSGNVCVGVSGFLAVHKDQTRPI